MYDIFDNIYIRSVRQVTMNHFKGSNTACDGLGLLQCLRYGYMTVGLMTRFDFKLKLAAGTDTRRSQI